MGQSQDGGSASLDADKSKCCALVLSGIIEVVVNAIANELEKATDVNKLNLEKELIDFVQIHESLAKDACLSRQGTGSRRGNVRAAALDIHDNLETGHSKVTQGQNSFLATSSIYQIMEMIPKIYDPGSFDKIGTSQGNSQQSQSKKSKGFPVISFILGICLRHIKLFPVLGKDELLRTLIYGDIKILGPALLRLICFLNLGANYETSQKKKESKGKKDVEELKEHFHLALVCLKELIMISLRSPVPTALLEDLLSVSIVEDAGLDDECQMASKIDDQPTRRKQLLIAKTLKPLFFKFLELSYYDEVEVNTLVFVSSYMSLIAA